MSLLEMSFSGAILVLLIVVVRAIAIHRFPKKIFLALWIIAIARLLIPFSVPVPVPVPSPVGVHSSAGGNMTDFDPAHTAISESHHSAFGAVFDGYQSDPVANTPQAAQAVPSISVWTALWIAGMTILAGIFLLSYIKNKQEFRSAFPIQNENITEWLNEHRLKRKIEIRQFGGITTPMTYGLFRPVILLPQNTDLDNKQQLEYILFHEYVHIRHCDTALKFFATIALCIHWFNPLIWVLYILFNRDIELTCDECVIRRFGTDKRSAYARTLISMEERKNFIAPFCNNFSKNAIEERIISIMKTKKSSAVALFAAGFIVAGAAGVFVTSVQANENNNASAVQSNGTSLSFVQTNGNNFEDVEGTIAETSITITRAGEDGTTYYSRDGGKTWTALTDEELEQYFSISGIEWWTYEEYAEWLENEKVQLQSMLGETGWTSGRGEFVWTQEIIDEAIAMYEEILENIKNGMLYSKAIYGENEEVVLSFDPTNIAVSVQEGIATAADFLEYKQYGLAWDEDKQALFLNGQRVRYFCDGAEIESGIAIRLEYVDAELKGDIDVHTVREPVENGDGSFDPMGKLIGLEKYSQEEFDARVLLDLSSEEFSYTFQSFTHETETVATEELLKDYVPFGLSYEIDPATGELSMSWQGKPVHSVFDIEKEVWIANNLYGSDLGPDAVDLEAVYEQGRLVGLQETQSLHAVETAFVIENDTAAFEQGMSFAERFGKYAPFGITYEEGDGLGNVYYNGRLVSHFVDLTPDGGAFTFSSAKGGGIAVKTVYDQNGKLTGVETVSA